MRNRLILAAFILSIFSLSAQDMVKEYNNRALSSIETDPATAIYYGEKSIRENSDIKSKSEYARSLYIEVRAWDVLGDRVKLLSVLELLESFLYNNTINDFESSAYVYIAEKLLELKQYDLLNEFITRKRVVSMLDDKDLAIFNILKIRYDLSQNIPVDREKVDNILSLAISLKIPDLIARAYYLYGDYTYEKDANSSIFYYKKATDHGNSYYCALAYKKLGELYNSENYYREAVIVSQVVGDYNLKENALRDLAGFYKERSNFKDLSFTIESLEYLNLQHSNFITTQYKKLEAFGIEQETLKLELERSENQRSLMVTLIISMSGIILFLTVMLLIQSYRLRGFNI